jgi:DNA-binding beta-propeller fold protein YncE
VVRRIGACLFAFLIGLELLTPAPSAALALVSSIEVGGAPFFITVNPTTDVIYADDSSGSDTVDVIRGATGVLTS